MVLRNGMIGAVLILASLMCVFAADIAGKWTAEFDSQVGVQKYIFDLKAEGSKLTGKAISNIDGAEAQTDIQEGRINGDEISFVENLKYQGMDLRIAYKGKVSGDEIKFSRTVGDAGGEEFVAKRAK
jgi:hypothetical protein